MRRNPFSHPLTAIIVIGISIGVMGAVPALAGTVAGTVTDDGGQALAGANVEVLGTRQAAIADENGEYSISSVPAGMHSVRASLIGYGQKTMEVAISGADMAVDFELQERPIPLSSTVISASAINEDVRRAPNKVEIIDREEIERSASRNIQEVLQNVEGIYLARGEGISDTFPKIVMRGLTTGYLGRNSAALILLNGHPLNGTLGSWETIGDLDAIPLAIIQKTEVIKGPYTSTYGSGATGGVVNLLTQRHFSAPIGGDVQIKGGPYGYRSVSPVVYGQRDQLAFSAWGEFIHGGERETRRRTNFKTGEVVWDDQALGFLADGRVEQNKYGFMLGYDFSPSDRVSVIGSWLEKFNNYNGRPISREEIGSEFLLATFEHQINDDLQLTVLGNYLNSTYDGPSDSTPSHPDSADTQTRIQQWPNRDLGFKIQLAGGLGDLHRFSAGVEWRRNKQTNRRYYGIFETLEFDVTGTQDIYSVFLEDKIALAARG